MSGQRLRSAWDREPAKLGASAESLARRRREHDDDVRACRESGLLLASAADFLTGVIFGLLIAAALAGAVWLWL